MKLLILPKVNDSFYDFFRLICSVNTIFRMVFVAIYHWGWRPTWWLRRISVKTFCHVSLFSISHRASSPTRWLKEFRSTINVLHQCYYWSNWIWLQFFSGGYFWSVKKFLSIFRGWSRSLIAHSLFSISSFFVDTSWLI